MAKLQTLMIMALGNAGKTEFPAELCAHAESKRDTPTDVYTCCPETHSFNADRTFLASRAKYMQILCANSEKYWLSSARLPHRRTLAQNSGSILIRVI